MSRTHPSKQDSDEEILSCVAAICRTDVGERDELPEFGAEDLAFRGTVHTHALSGASADTGSGTAHENRPAFATFAFMVRFA